MTTIHLLIRNATELLILSPSSGDDSGLGIIRNGAVAIRDGRIFWIEETTALPKEFALSPEGVEIDGFGKVAMPGFIGAE